MGFLIFFLIVVAPLAIWGFVKLRKSKWLGGFTEDLIHEPDKSFKETDDLIGSAKNADADLSQRIEDNVTAASQIGKDSEKIREYKEENEKGGSDQDK